MSIKKSARKQAALQILAAEKERIRTGDQQEPVLEAGSRIRRSYSEKMRDSAEKSSSELRDKLAQFMETPENMTPCYRGADPKKEKSICRIQ